MIWFRLNAQTAIELDSLGPKNELTRDELLNQVIKMGIATMLYARAHKGK